MLRQLGASLQSERGSLPEQPESDMSLKFTDGDLTIRRLRLITESNPALDRPMRQQAVNVALRTCVLVFERALQPAGVR
jgi:hypothetical protein